MVVIEVEIAVWFDKLLVYEFYDILLPCDIADSGISREKRVSLEWSVWIYWNLLFVLLILFLL